MSLVAISKFFECSIATIKTVLADTYKFREGLDQFGKITDDYLRVAAVHACWQFLSLRGWQVGESDAKSVFDLFCIKNNETKKIQVRSSRIFDKFDNWPKFKTSKLRFNTKKCERVQFNAGDFDYWFFYSINRDAWMIPFDQVDTKAEISMHGFDEFYCGPF